MGQGAELGEMWFEELAFNLLHPAQKAIVQALRIETSPVAKADLQVMLEGQGHRGVERHIKRLLSLSAIESVSSKTGPVKVWYRLTKRPGRGES
jgi:hypothetical protein